MDSHQNTKSLLQEYLDGIMNDIRIL
jgi:hypothetical protein